MPNTNSKVARASSEYSDEDIYEDGSLDDEVESNDEDLVPARASFPRRDSLDDEDESMDEGTPARAGFPKKKASRPERAPPKKAHTCKVIVKTNGNNPAKVNIHRNILFFYRDGEVKLATGKLCGKAVARLIYALKKQVMPYSHLNTLLKASRIKAMAEQLVECKCLLVIDEQEDDDQVSERFARPMTRSEVRRFLVKYMDCLSQKYSSPSASISSRRAREDDGTSGMEQEPPAEPKRPMRYRVAQKIIEEVFVPNAAPDESVARAAAEFVNDLLDVDSFVGKISLTFLDRQSSDMARATLENAYQLRPGVHTG